MPLLTLATALMKSTPFQLPPSYIPAIFHLLLIPSYYNILILDTRIAFRLLTDAYQIEHILTHIEAMLLLLQYKLALSDTKRFTMLLGNGNDRI